MKKMILLVAFLSTGLYMAAQNATFNDENVEKRSVKPFRSIKVGDGIDLHLSQGNACAGKEAFVFPLSCSSISVSIF